MKYLIQVEDHGAIFEAIIQDETESSDDPAQIQYAKIQAEHLSDALARVGTLIVNREVEKLSERNGS